MADPQRRSRLDSPATALEEPLSHAERRARARADERRRRQARRQTRFVWLERIVIAVASVALASIVIAIMSGYFSGSDQPSLSGAGLLGRQFADQGDELLAPGSSHPPYDSNPPTSGPHVPVPVVADGVELSDDQILEALAAGDVLFVYGSPQPPRGLSAVATRLSGPFTPPLAASGLAVVLVSRPGMSGVVALAWTRMLSLPGVNASLLTGFVQEWLGHGARG